jgi:hypothetical protein
MAVLFGILAIAMLAINYFGEANFPGGEEGDLFVSFTVVYVIFGLFLIFLLLWSLIDLIKFCFKKPKFSPILLVLAIGIFFGARFIIAETNYSSAKAILPLMQENLIEVVAYKTAGNQLNSDKKDYALGYQWPAIKEMARRAVPALISLPSAKILEDYRKNTVIWLGKMRDTTENPKEWVNLGDAPASFTIKLNKSQAAEQFKLAAQDVLVLKKIGDYNIKNVDIDGMRYVLARAIVKKYFIEAIVASQSKNGKVEPLCYMDKDKKVCSDKILKLADDVIKNVKDLLNFDETSVKKWPEIWAETIKNIDSSLAGEAKDAKDFPGEQAFTDECYARGGELSDLPVLSGNFFNNELGGVCNFKLKNDICWDFLSASGGRFSGGSSGCSTKNYSAIPVNIFGTKEEAISWDGTYKIYGKMQCAGDLPGTPPIQQIVTDTKVANNKVNEQKQDLKINADGFVSFTGSMPVGTGNADFKTTYQFYKDGADLRLRGNLTMDISMVDKKKVKTSAHCVGIFLGIRD